MNCLVKQDFYLGARKYIAKQTADFSQEQATRLTEYIEPVVGPGPVVEVQKEISKPPKDKMVKSKNVKTKGVKQ